MSSAQPRHSPARGNFGRIGRRARSAWSVKVVPWDSSSPWLMNDEVHARRVDAEAVARQWRELWSDQPRGKRYQFEAVRVIGSYVEVVR